MNERRTISLRWVETSSAEQLTLRLTAGRNGPVDIPITADGARLHPNADTLFAFGFLPACELKYDLRIEGAVSAELRARAGLSLDRAYDPAGVGRQLLAIVASGDRRKLLRRIAAPTLVVHGAADPLVRPDAGRDTAKNIAGAKLVMIEGMGHDLPAPLCDRLVGAIADHCAAAAVAA